MLCCKIDKRKNTSYLSNNCKYDVFYNYVKILNLMTLLNVELLGQGFTCLEKIAYLNGWITKNEVLKTYELVKKNQYGLYLKYVLDGKYREQLY